MNNKKTHKELAESFSVLLRRNYGSFCELNALLQGDAITLNRMKHTRKKNISVYVFILIACTGLILFLALQEHWASIPIVLFTSPIILCYQPFVREQDRIVSVQEHFLKLLTTENGQALKTECEAVVALNNQRDFTAEEHEEITSRLLSLWLGAHAELDIYEDVAQAEQRLKEARQKSDSISQSALDARRMAEEELRKTISS